MSKPLIDTLIYGAGGFAREVAWLMSSSSGPRKPVAFISDDAKPGDLLHDHPVLTLDAAVERYSGSQVVIAIAAPAVRENIAQKISKTPLELAKLIHSSVITDKSVSIGPGSIICANNLIMPDVTIANNVHINLNCTIGHDCIIEDYVTISPGVHISGSVHIRKGAFIGTGANFIQGTAEKPLEIGEGSVIGAGACVTSDTEAHRLYVGVPAVRKK